MIERRIWRQLRPVASRFRRFYVNVALTVFWLLGAAVCYALIWYAGTGSSALWTPSFPRIFIGGVLIGSLVIAWLARRPASNLAWIAHKVESHFPALEARLLTAMEQQPCETSGGYSFLQETVIRETLRHDLLESWTRVVPTRRLAFSYVTSLAALALCATGLVQLSNLATPPLAGPTVPPILGVSQASGEMTVVVEPGNAEVERGMSVLITARFAGAVPPNATLVAIGAEGEQRLTMRKSLDDPLFGVKLDDPRSDQRYHIEYLDARSDEFLLTLFEFPRLIRADAALVYPSYTTLPDKELKDVRRVTAVEGTVLTVICHLNKRVPRAVLVGRDGHSLTLEAPSSEEPVYRASWTLEKSDRYELELTDEKGRSDKPPHETFVVDVSPNKPPDLKWAAPGRDMRVSPLEEMRLAGNVADDFGVTRYGIGFSIGGEEPKEIELGAATAGPQRVDFQHLLDFEALRAVPDQLASFHLWAEDVAGDGATRRVESDMYFAEVRHFEEIFREGQSPPSDASQQQPQQQGGNQQKAEQLAELQKQVINGTWKLRRTAADRVRNGKFTEDATTLLEGQTAALDQLGQLAEQLQDAESLSHFAEARGHMERAQQQLREAADAGSTAEDNTEAIGKLPAALSAEQNAYQALLRLRAREHDVVRSQQSSSSQSASSSSGSSRSQEQLNELELKDTANRYETQRAAAPVEDPAQQAARQALSRLRELAQRQDDLNDRVKELQAALEAAQSAAQRQELERQLKRLREEQQEILRDTEELQQKLEQPGNTEQRNQERQQLAETRENVRRASEALQEGQLSQALTEGTRAEREFKDLQEQLRKQTASQFADEMRSMREQAQQLARDEEELAERLAKLMEKESQSLRESSDRAEVGESLRQQSGRIDDVLEAMKSTVERAEPDEPLLARKLYDTYRETQQSQPQPQLKQAAEWIEQGFPDQAQPQERLARQTIDRLAEGVSAAAESVLGDDVEAMRRARDELNRLAEQLAGEVDRNDPKSQGQQPQGQQPQGQQPQGQQPQGQQPQGQQPQGQQPQGQQPQGQQPQGQQPQGQQPQGQQPQGQQPQGQQGETPADGTSGSSPRDGSPNGGRTAEGAGGGGQTRHRGGEATEMLENLSELVEAADRSAAPLTGEDFMSWSDRMRDIEEMLSDPEMRGEAARIRDRARGVRIEYKRHSQAPNWDLVRDQIQRPLFELRDRLADEIRRHEKDPLAPVDRDPVPLEFDEQVRRYYERLGRGRP